MSHSWLPSRIVRFWLSIFWRAAWSILRFLIQQILENLADFQPDSIPVFDKIHGVDFSQRVRDHVRNFVHFVPADSHSTALYLRTSSLFTLRNISW